MATSSFLRTWFIPDPSFCLSIWYTIEGEEMLQRRKRKGTVQGPSLMLQFENTQFSFPATKSSMDARASSSSSQSPLGSASACRQKLHPLPCSSSPHRTHFVGLRRGPRKPKFHSWSKALVGGVCAGSAHGLSSAFRQQSRRWRPERRPASKYQFRRPWRCPACRRPCRRRWQ